MKKKSKGRVKARDEATAQEKRQRQRKKAGYRKALFYAAVISVFLLVIGLSVNKIVDLKIEQGKLLAKQDRLTEQKKELKTELKNVDDEEYVEQQARKLLQMIRPGETLYVLPTEEEREEMQKETQKED